MDRELHRVLDRYGVEVRYSREVRSVDADARTLTIGHGEDEETLSYDVLHAVPPQRAPEWIAGSGLSADDDPRGFVDVDPETLRHRRYADIWSLGDAARVATRPSGGAIRPQAKVLTKNLRSALRGQPPTARYDGYSVVPSPSHAGPSSSPSSTGGVTRDRRFRSGAPSRASGARPGSQTAAFCRGCTGT